MKPFRPFLLLTIAVLFLLQGNASLRAYILEGRSWPAGHIVMHMGLGANGIDLSDGAGSWNQVGTDALGDWNPYLNSVQFTYVNDSSLPGDGDGTNSVFFSSTIFGDRFGSGVLAVTTAWTDDNGTTTIENDVVVNSAIDWDSYAGDLYQDPVTHNYIYDLRRVLDHEFGHVLGLDHPDDFGQHVTAIMNSVISDLDHIAQDDINGVTAIYGHVDNQAPSLVVTQPANNAIIGTGTVVISGTASDSGLGDNGIQSVKINGFACAGGTATGTGTANWSKNVVLTLGVNSYNIVATDTKGNSSTRQLVVNYATPPTVTGATMSATSGSAFTYQINATGGGLTYSATGLPDGLALNPTTGLITGLPSGQGTFTIRITVRNAAGSGAGTLVLTLSQLSQTITPFATIPTQTLAKTSVTIALPTSSSGLAVAVSVVSGPASLSGTTLSLTGVGTVVLAAAQPGNASYGPAVTVNTSFAVTKVPQTVTFHAVPDKTTLAAPFTLLATASSGLKTTYSLVSGPGKLSGTTVTLTGVSGTLTVKASQAGNALYASAEALQDIEVKPVAQTITFPALATVTFGAAPVPLLAAASTKLPITYSITSGPGLISGNTVKITAAGTIIILATQPGNGTYKAISASQRLIVNKANQTITFPAVTGATYSLASTLAAKSTSGLPITYTVTSGTATISGSKITFSAPGKFVVAANQVGSTSYNPAKQVGLLIVVAKAPQTIGALKALPAKTFGDKPFYVTSPKASSGLATVITVKSGPATISGGNLITLTGGGTVVIAANQRGDTNFAPGVEQTTSFVVSPAAQTITFAAITPKVVGTSFNLTATASSGLAITYVITGPATLTGTTVKVTGTGVIGIVAQQAGNANYLRATSVLQRLAGIAAP